MAKTDNPHALRLYESIAKNADPESAERIANKIPLSKSADFVKKFKWAKGVCADLEATFSEDAVMRIRMDCACGPDEGKAGKLRKMFETSGSLQSFAEKANALGQGFSLKAEGEALILVYPQCYCSCVKRVEEPISKTWCYCSLGYAKRMFERVFNRPVQVDLLESVKAGADQCAIRIEPKI